MLLRIDTPIEVDYYQHGGILPYVLRELMSAGPAPAQGRGLAFSFPAASGGRAASCGAWPVSIMLFIRMQVGVHLALRVGAEDRTPPRGRRRRPGGT